MRKYLFIGGGGLAALLIAGFFAFSAYRKIEAKNLKRAADYIAAHDYRSAQLTLEQAVQVNPDNLEARHALAEFYTQLAPARALPLWEVLTAADPGNDDYSLGQSRAALRLNKYDIVAAALSRVSPAGQSRASFKRHKAALALATGDRQSLSLQLDELAAMEPDNARMQFNAAAASVHNADPVESGAAKIKLLELAKGQPLRIRATLQLLQVAASEPNPEDAIRTLAAAILNKPDSRRAGLFELAEHMKAEVAPVPDDAADLIDWMTGRDWAREAFLWAGGLPLATQKSPPVRRALADCTLRMRDWVRLQEQLHAGAWGKMADGLVELAFAARVQKDGAGRARALDTWGDALTLAAKNKGKAGFEVLEKLAASWQWTEAVQSTLWRAHELMPREVSYLRKLAALAESTGDSAQLDKVYAEWTGAYSGDRFAWASRLYLAVLRDNLDAAERSKAAELITQTELLPEEALIWAWVEARKGDDAAVAALDRIGTLLTQARLSPRAALLHAALLEKVGRLSDARESWRIASTLTAKLPEERAWLNKLRPRLDSAR